MNIAERVDPPGKFWFVAIAALTWNGIGVFSFISRLQMTGEEVFALPALERQVFMLTPEWVTMVFGMAVIFGSLGAIYLLVRRKTAVFMFMVSLLAVLVQMAYSLYISGYLDIFSAKTMLLPAVIIGISVFLLHFSRNAIVHRWIS